MVSLKQLQQIYHVKVMANVPPGNLDLNSADEEEFSPDKLRSTLERFYMTVVRIFAVYMILCRTKEREDHGHDDIYQTHCEVEVVE